MKKMFIPVLALLGMVACTNENEPKIVNQSNEPVKVQLSAGITATTRTVIDQTSSFTAQVIASNKTNDYSTLLWTGENAGNISIVNGNVTFEPEQNYPIDGSSIYMKAFAPRATVSNGVAQFTITGDEDILFTNAEINGSKTDHDGKILTLDHLLTQLKIQVKASDANAITTWGSITSIKVKDAATVLDLNVNNGELTANATPAKDNLSLKGTKANQDLTLTAVDAGYIMLLPSTTAYTLLIETSNKSEATEVPISTATTVKGKIHTITLAFNAVDVSTTSKVNDWGVDGEAGTGTVE